MPGATVLLSVLYKAGIEIGLFHLIQNVSLHRFAFCVLELLLLGVYWRFTFMFAKLCRHHSYTQGEYYLAMCVTFGLYSALYLAAYLLLGMEKFSWFFRLTFNLCGVRFVTRFPPNLLPYMAAYLAITFIIMLLEPFIARKMYENFILFTTGKRIS